MYSSPITLQIQFNPGNQILAGSQANQNTITKFDSAQIFLKQMDLANRALSIGRRLKADPTRIQTYPFIHATTFQLNLPNLTAALPGSAPQNNFPLQSFINADLLAISIGVVRQSDITSNPNSTGSIQNVALNPFNYVNISDVQLVYNGLNMIISPASLWKVYNMSSVIGSQVISQTVMSNASGTNPAPIFNFSAPIGQYVFLAEFTRTRALQFENHYCNTWRIPNQTMQFQFNVPFETDPSTGGSRPNPDNYVMIATYYYNGAIENSGGESRIYFD